MNPETAFPGCDCAAHLSRGEDEIFFEFSGSQDVAWWSTGEETTRSAATTEVNRLIREGWECELFQI